MNSISKTLLTISLAVMFIHMTACSFSNSSNNQPSVTKLSSKDKLLNDHQTHQFLKIWHDLDYTTQFTQFNIKFENKHPFAQSFHSINSGFSVAPFHLRSKGIGLPVSVQTRSKKFTNLTDKAFHTNIQPGSLIAVKQANGDLHITLIDPRSQQKHLGKKLAIQDNIVLDNIINDPTSKALKVRGLIAPLKNQHLQGFYLSQPYDKNKIPLIMVHGILSSPDTFVAMAEAIEFDPDLHQTYQIWHYFYPTGNPWVATAHEFRTSYRQLLKKLDPAQSHPNIRKTNIICHSMGGLITRLSLSTPENTLPAAYLGDFQKSALTSQQREKLQPYFHYKPLTEPNRVIFIAVPHRGSKLAAGIVGWVTDQVIAIPNTLIKGTINILRPGMSKKLSRHTKKLLTKGENAVDQLDPKNPVFTALNQMKFPSNVEAHSIIGDLGHGLKRVYSDGVVTYGSSHLDFTKSEKIIRSGHGLNSHPKAIKQVLKILRNK